MTSIAQTGNNPLGFEGWDLISGMKTATESAKTIQSPPKKGVATPDQARLASMVSAMARGDESGLGALYDAAASRVYSLALRITRSSAAAEDVTAEVFHQSWRNAGSFDAARGSVMTWLLTMCRSRAIDHLRRRDEAESHAEPELLAEATTADDPQELLSALESHSALRAALNDLAPVQRQMIALAFYRGLSHQEIADHCQMPLGTVKTHVRKAIERLRLAVSESTI